MCEKAGDHLPHRSGDEKWDLGFFFSVYGCGDERNGNGILVE